MAKMAEDTPLIKQFFEVKAQHPEALLLYRVGDFYETYSDDAVTASRVLGLVQTKKSNGDKGPIPMAGFPHHAIENYLTKLVRAGFKVAICDQLEDPKFAKKLVKRGVTEIVTPGISFGENMLEIKENNFLCGLAFERDLCGAAFLDVSTGQFQVAQGSLEYIGTLMGSLSPKELVVPRSCEKGVKDRFGNYYVTSLDEWAFVYDAAVEKLKRQLRVDSLKGFAVDTMPLGICAAGALMVYLEQTQHVGLRNISWRFSRPRRAARAFPWCRRWTAAPRRWAPACCAAGWPCLSWTARNSTSATISCSSSWTGRKPWPRCRRNWENSVTWTASSAASPTARLSRGRSCS